MEGQADRAAYMREYRKRRPEAAARNRKLTRARYRALFRLGQSHPAELRRLYEEELWAEGIDSVREYRPLDDEEATSDGR